MHAPPDRASGIQLGQRATAALVGTLLLVGSGCSTGSGDSPGIAGPSTGSQSSVSTPPGSSGPAVSISDVDGVGVPRLAGHGTADTILEQAAAGLPGGCQPLTEDDSTRVASFVWKCGSKVQAAVTVGLSPDRRLALGDLLTGGYQSYLSSVASTQFRASDVTNPQTTDLGTWFVTSQALDVVFPNGIVSYPLASLGAYVNRAGPL